MTEWFAVQRYFGDEALTLCTRSLGVEINL